VRQVTEKKGDQLQKAFVVLFLFLYKSFVGAAETLEIYSSICIVFSLGL
jgi:hypothetical protein